MAAAYQLLAEGLQHVGLAAAGISKNQNIVRSLQEAAIEQGAHLPCGLWRKTLGVERFQRFLQRELRLSKHLGDTVLLAVLALPLDQFVKIPLVAERFALRLPGHFFVALPDGGQVQILQALCKLGFHIHGAAHCTPLRSTADRSWSATPRG